MPVTASGLASQDVVATTMEHTQTGRATTGRKIRRFALLETDSLKGYNLQKQGDLDNGDLHLVRP